MSRNTDEPTTSIQPELNQSQSEPNTLQVESEILRKGFTILPNYVLRSKGLSRDAKLLYGILLSYAWQTDSCFPGYETLMNDMQCAREALSKYIKELREVGLIEVKRRGQGLTSIYTIKDMPNNSQKFENRTSRSSKSKQLEVSKSNGNNTQSKKTQINKTQSFRKGKPLNSEKEGGGETNGTYSHIAHRAIGNEQGTETKQSKVAAPRLSQPPITQDEIDRNKTRHRNASGLMQIGEIIGIPPSHQLELNKQFGNGRARTATGKSEQGAGKRGNWKAAPLFIQGVIADWFSLEMNDQAINSTITRVHRIFKDWSELHTDLEGEQLQDTFLTIMQEARSATKNHKVTNKTATGRTNRTPYFLACLEQLSGLRDKPIAETNQQNGRQPIRAD